MKKILFIITVAILPILTFGQGCEAPSDEGGIKLFGYIQPQYNSIFDGNSSNEFYFNRARIGVTGVIPYDFSYYAVLEMSAFNSSTSAFLLDAYVSYDRFSFAKVALGQFKAPFSRELQTGCHKLLTINRSKSVVELVSPLRDMGLMISGGSDTTLFKYQVGVFNGTGINNPDDDTEKSYIGRLILNLGQNFNIGGSYKHGTNKNLDPTVTALDIHTRFGFEAYAKFGEFQLQGEYIQAKDDGSYYVGGGCDGPGTLVSGSVERRGFYGMASYMFDFGLQPVAKFEMFDSDISVDNMAEYLTTIGINYFFNDWTRLQVNYCMIQESAATQIDNDRLMIQMQIKF